ncbi:1,2-phenylacetyl-CoA epoxidase subunit PaaD [Enterovibrio norvegicus]|uniref:1,2-phenylacetyl-CoA epoxidase subunit PaaD n=1 Tax=Enterovibrio norvegicus TaxID=188144 RepID=UPI0002D62672|nr:1,2-phenylacetyl-CoA epoxidase subunit PaaD [Enterovibrio norvegicus]
MNTIPLTPRARFERTKNRFDSNQSDVWRILDGVTDPEIPVLSIWDIGILRDVTENRGRILITITPTYSGCPAVETIKEDIYAAMHDAGYTEVSVNVTLFPPWSTDDMSESGQRKLREYGIAPPSDAPSGCLRMTPKKGVRCPHCGSAKTSRISEFGSTACKALFRCESCQEPFDFFKCL